MHSLGEVASTLLKPSCARWALTLHLAKGFCVILKRAESHESTSLPEVPDQLKIRRWWGMGGWGGGLVSFYFFFFFFFFYFFFFF